MASIENDNNEGRHCTHKLAKQTQGKCASQQQQKKSKMNSNNETH